jgi:hypothetical protein
MDNIYRTIYPSTLRFLSHLHTSALGPAVLDGAVSPYTPLADYCIHIPNLTGKQKRMCERQPDAMKAVFDGIQVVTDSFGAGVICLIVQRSMAECQQQFAKERWNCSTHDLTSEVLLKRECMHEIYMSMCAVGSREAAFIYAISSAGVVHHLAHVCAKGVVDGCGCAQAKNYAHARDEQGRLFRYVHMMHLTKPCPVGAAVATMCNMLPALRVGSSTPASDRPMTNGRS